MEVAIGSLLVPVFRSGPPNALPNNSRAKRAPLAQAGESDLNLARNRAKGRAMPQVEYSVDFIDGVWKVGLAGKQFGPYSTLDAAVAAASAAAHKAEAQGYEAVVTVNAPDEAPAEEADRDAA
jgi:hypothetical protein